MHARRSRTSAAIARAVLELAAERPLDEITVTALAARAGITRETLYQHTSGVAEALASALADEFGPLEAAAADLPVVSPTGDSVFREPTRRVVAHIAARADVYRHAMAPHLHARLRELLIESLTRGLLVHVEAHPEIAPDVVGARPGPFELRSLAVYGAAGTVGVLEEWLASEHPIDLDSLTDLILAAAPEWWQGRSGTRGVSGA